MRLPWGEFDSFVQRCGSQTRFALLGCLSFEERCVSVAKSFASSGLNCIAPHFVEIRDPADAFPDYTSEISKKIDCNWKVLDSLGIGVERKTTDLLATEDEMLDALGEWNSWSEEETLVLDISSFPRRFFCFILKRLMNNKRVRNLVVTYTQAGPSGYSADHLCDDPMPCDCLPGFGAALPPASEWLVASVGFEALNISSLVQPYRETTRTVKFILAFPPSVHTNQRQWNTLLEIAGTSASDHLRSTDIAMVSLWDTERVYLRLQQWSNELRAEPNSKNARASGDTTFSLAPFGPKPHSLAMALFAIKNRCGMYYTQPKAYNPEYSSGEGKSWFYVVKWNGTACFDREVALP